MGPDGALGRPRTSRYARLCSDLPPPERLMQDADSGYVAYSAEERIGRIRFCRPTKKNALTTAMYAQFAAALTEANDDPGVRAVLISGAGGSFTAGNDLRDFIDNPPSGMDSPVFQVIHRLVFADKPIVTAVEGAAVGIGTTMLLHCDINVLATNATLKLPFVPLGLTPEAGSSWLLPQLLGVHRASALFYTGDALPVDEAKACGLAAEVVEPGMTLDVAHAIASRIAQQPPEAVQASKRLMREPIRAALQPVLLDESHTFVSRLQSPEFYAACEAFFTRRA